MAQIPTPQPVVDARTEARNVLIGYLLQPPTETDGTLRASVQRLADELDVSYEAAFRYLLVGRLE